MKDDDDNNNDDDDAHDMIMMVMMIDSIIAWGARETDGNVCRIHAVVPLREGRGW
jgi:hypothetical protein